jgi:hypothetical protein
MKHEELKMNVNRFTTPDQGIAPAGNLELRGLPGDCGASVSMPDWEERINHLFARGRASVLDLARVVCSTKSALPRGQWTHLWKSGRLPFSKRKGEMLAVIGRHLGALNAQMFARLPGGWSVLYHLAQFPRPALQNLVQDGTVHPALTLKETKELLPRLRGRTQPLTRRSNVIQRLRRFQEFVRTTFSDWPLSDQRFVATELRLVADELASVPHQDARLDGILSFPQNSASALEPTFCTSAL